MLDTVFIYSCGDVMKKELPAKEIRHVELRASSLEDDGSMTIEGYAIVFDSAATHYGFTEIINRGALDQADMSDVVFRYNHKDSWLVLARTRNKSLALTVDDRGLYIKAELIDTQTNRDVYKSIKAELLDGMSFSFSVDEDEWNYDSNTRNVKSIKKLFDVSVVDTPFYSDTEIYARALGDLEKHQDLLESEKRAVKVMKLRNEILAKG